jgi:phosphate transport system permease protein
LATEAIGLRREGGVTRRRLLTQGSRYLFLGATLAALLVLGFLMFLTLKEGLARLDWDFITHYPSRHAEKAGIRPALLGTMWVVGVSLILAIPVAVGTAIWIEEFAPRHGFVSFVKLNLANLAGVPSIIYGILGLAVFVRFYNMGPVILAAGFTLALMIIPMTVITSQEAIRQVPPSQRDGALALGATRWQAVWHSVLPSAMPGIMTGIILAVSRAVGETAAIIMIGGFTFLQFSPSIFTPLQSLMDAFTILPIQIYGWTIDPREEFRENAAAAIIVLMVGVMIMNIAAALIRERFRRS